jgi:hypothetical protein
LNNDNIIAIVDSSTLSKITTIDGWNANVYSLEAYTYPKLSFTVNTITPSIFVGLSSYPSSNTYISNLEYAFHLDKNGLILIYESGILIHAVIGQYLTTTVFAIQYDGQCVTYYVDGFSVYETAVELGVPLYANFLLYNSGYSIENIHFDPLLKGLDGVKGDTGTQGDTGYTGATGSTGSTGAAGVGVPSGGRHCQVLIKASCKDHDTKWVDVQSIGRDLQREKQIDDTLSSLITKMNEVTGAVKNIETTQKRVTTLLVLKSLKGKFSGGRGLLSHRKKSKFPVHSAKPRVRSRRSSYTGSHASLDSRSEVSNSDISSIQGSRWSHIDSNRSVTTIENEGIRYDVSIRFDGGNAAGPAGSVSEDLSDAVSVRSDNSRMTVTVVFDGGDSNSNFVYGTSLNIRDRSDYVGSNLDEIPDDYYDDTMTIDISESGSVYYDPATVTNEFVSQLDNEDEQSEVSSESVLRFDGGRANI